MLKVQVVENRWRVNLPILGQKEIKVFNCMENSRLWIALLQLEYCFGIIWSLVCFSIVFQMYWFPQLIYDRIQSKKTILDKVYFNILTPRDAFSEQKSVIGIYLEKRIATFTDYSYNSWASWPVKSSATRFTLTTMKTSQLRNTCYLWRKCA